MKINPERCALSDPETRILCGKPRAGSVMVAWADFGLPGLGTPEGFEAGIPVCQEHLDIVKEQPRGISLDNTGRVYPIESRPEGIEGS